MKRYSTTKKKIDKSGIRVNSTTYYHEISVSDSDTFIYPKEGERLDYLAGIYYGDSSFWWVLAAASGIGYALQVPPGTVIRVPSSIAEVFGVLV